MEAFGDMFVSILKVWTEMVGAFFSVLPKILKFILWLISAVFILPCVFVAGNLYPTWVEWGDDF